MHHAFKCSRLQKKKKKKEEKKTSISFLSFLSKKTNSSGGVLARKVATHLHRLAVNVYQGW